MPTSTVWSRVSPCGPKLGGKWFGREPVYDEAQKIKRTEDRLARAKAEAGQPNINTPQEMTWCIQCTYPNISATLLAFDEQGVCTGCRNSGQKFAITDSEWERRKQPLVDLLEKKLLPER